MSLDTTFERIDRHYDNLYREVGNEQHIHHFTTYMVAGFKHNAKYLELNIACAEDVRKQWEKWKNCAQEDKVLEYEEKLKQCDGYLKLIEAIVTKEIQKQIADEQAIVSQIEVLLRRKERSDKFILFSAQKIPVEDIEKAFELVKSIEFTDYTKQVLVEIFHTYLNQKFFDYLKKAYKVAIYIKEKDPETNYFLDAIINKCISFKEVGESFLVDILKYYPDIHEGILQESLPEEPYEPWTLEKLQNDQIKKGDENAIRERQAENLVDAGRFQEAFAVVDTIPDLKYRTSTITLLLARCIKTGNEKALRFTLEYYLKVDSPYKNNDLVSIVEACKKNKLRDLAIETANHIDDPRLQTKILSKIKYAREFDPNWANF